VARRGRLRHTVRVHRLVAVTLLLAAVGMPASIGHWTALAQAARSDSARAERLQAWRTAVEEHRPGHRDRPLVDIATWSEDDLTAVVSDVSQLSRFLARAHMRLRQSGQVSTFNYGRQSLSMAEAQQLLGLTDEEARQGDVSRLVLRAALLHTDIATLIEDRHDRVPPRTAASSRRTAVMVLDGQEHGAMVRGPHWELGRHLLELLPDDPAVVELTRRWYFATSAFMQSRSLMSDMHPHIARALQRFPADPHLLFYAGSMHETFASPGIQAALPDIRLPPGEKLAVGSAPAHLQQARQAFERAVAADPHLLEARLRLGRILSVIGRYEEAAEQLRHVLRDPPSRVLEYYAALFLGEAQAALGRTDAAWQSFERAAALYPSAQSPRLAISRLARLAGGQSDAVTALLQVLATNADDPARFDPWWKYFSAREDEADDLIAAWRECVETRE
jgi:tetratricopeptide (TPR) repeat protein